jgi:protein phosphatase
MVQQLVDAGIIPPHEAASHPDANRITRALGMATTVQVEVTATWQPLRVGDVLLLMTDGVSDLVEAHELRDIVRERMALGPAVVCQEIISRANARGGHDNATIQVLQILAVPERRERTTLDDVAGSESNDPQSLGTKPASQTAGITPTLVDENPHSTARHTEPNLAPPRFGPPRVAPLPRPVPPSPIRAGLLVAVGAALLVGLTAALALFVRHMRSEDDPVAAPSAVEPEPSSSDLATTELVADPEPPPPQPTASAAPSAAPEAVPSSQGSAMAPGPSDAGAPEVPPDGRAAHPAGSVTPSSR